MKIGLITLVAGICAFVLSACNNNQAQKQARYEGNDISDIAEIQRDKKTKAASLKINTNGKWQIYSGNRVRTIDLSKPLLQGEGSGTFALQVADSTRSYFQLVTDEGRAILSERLLPMTGGFNFRDLGGIKTIDGRFVKWGKVFRSDDLHSLTDEDLTYLSSIPIISVVDFRSEQEINQAPDRIPESVHKDYKLSISPGNLSSSSDSSAFDLSKLESLDMDSIMIDINIQLVSEESSINMYKRFFGLLQDNYKIPLLFHCTAGKDRTGMGAALFLLALGVDEERVMEDYLLSNQYIKAKFAPMIARYPAFAPMAGVDARYLQAGLDQIKKEHGTIENYLKKVLNVDIDKLREMYLY